MQSPPPPSSTMTWVTVRISMAKCSKAHDHWHCIHDIQYAQVHITCGFHVCVSCLSHVHLMYVSYSMYGVRYVSVTSNKCNIINTSWAKLIFRCCLSLDGSRVESQLYEKKTPELSNWYCLLGSGYFPFRTWHLCFRVKLWGYQPWFPTAVTRTLGFFEAIKSLQLQTAGSTAPGAIPDLLTCQVGNQLKQLLRKQDE